MITTKNASTSIRIDTKIKNRIEILAKNKRSKFTQLLSEILREYLDKEEKKAKILAFTKLQKELQEIENWTAKDELEAIEKSKISKNLNLE
jgi:predicted transcriptional regulator